MRFNYESQAPLRAEASQPGLRVTFQEGPGQGSLLPCASTSQLPASLPQKGSLSLAWPQ